MLDEDRHGREVVFGQRHRSCEMTNDAFIRNAMVKILKHFIVFNKRDLRFWLEIEVDCTPEDLQIIAREFSDHDWINSRILFLI